jgi:hypothetical protein
MIGQLPLQSEAILEQAAEITTLFGFSFLFGSHLARNQRVSSLVDVKSQEAWMQILKCFVSFDRYSHAQYPFFNA